MIEYVEIERDAEGRGKGDINLVKPHYRAILHNWDGGRLVSTLFQVNASREEIDSVVDSHPDVKHYSTLKEAQIRGMLIKDHATPTIAEVDKQADKLKTKYNIDLTKHTHSKTGKNLIRHLKEEAEHIGTGNQKCTACGTVQDRNRNFCVNCDADLRKVGKPNVSMFDIDRWTKNP